MRRWPALWTRHARLVKISRAASICGGGRTVQKTAPFTRPLRPPAPRLFIARTTVSGYIKLALPAGKANPAPPVGPALGAKVSLCRERGAACVEKTPCGGSATAVPSCRPPGAVQRDSTASLAMPSHKGQA